MEYTYEDLLPHFRAIVAEEGEDFIYPMRTTEHGVIGCYYSWDGAPDCGVGRVLHRIGLSVDDLRTMDDMGEELGMLYSWLEQGHQIAFTAGAQTLMEWFQSWQDEGVPWGKSLQQAIKKVDQYSRL